MILPQFITMEPITEINVGMYGRLKKSSYDGDVDELNRLLQEDPLLLHRPYTLQQPDSPLHIAASLGCADFVKEILIKKPEYIKSFNTHGLTALHLACANEHLLVVRELLKSNNSCGVDICDVRDKNGWLPIHTAASTGNVPILEELVSACSSDVLRKLTCLGDNILHLVVKSNCFNGIKFLVERMESNHEFLNKRDAKGNTILHLATSRRQLQTIQLLLGKKWIDVNAKNKKGSTILDILVDLPREHGDFLLGEMIRAAGGTTTEIIIPVGTVQPSEPSDNQTASLCIRWKYLKRLLLKLFPPLSSKERVQYKEERDTLMIVATLIATITFQGGINPPGGFAENDDNEKKLIAGQALIAKKLDGFLLCDMVGLLCSLTVILLMICGFPQWKYAIIVSRLITWIAAFFTGLAFFFAILNIFPNYLANDRYTILFLIWYLTMSAFLAYMVICFHIFMLRKISRCIMSMKTRPGRLNYIMKPVARPLVVLIGVFMVASGIATCVVETYFLLILTSKIDGNLFGN